MDRAKSSLAVSKIKLNKDILYEDLCFQAQQVVEKSTKGLLIFYDIAPKKTHDLVLLIRELSNRIDIP
ncbi:MAG: HEPN domain-containing protein [Clostridiales bacterium]|nr:HEPN domain-containing protein [Clostridiales bacterium]